MALQIIRPGSGDHTFELEENTLTKILLQDKIKDRYVCVVSVAGAFRKGKSFLQNFFLRYMHSKYVKNEVSDWLGDENVPLSGFSWRGGSERDTTGILMWSEIFLYDFPNGEKIAIILLDTQGAFDSQSTMKDCSTIFALSTMLSSVQIFNLSQNIQENDLQHLQLFTEYGRLALADTGKTPFQRLQFLVRDWSHLQDAEYGPVGGQFILNRRLMIDEEQPPELQDLRRHIRSCFTQIECFLMPHPGFEVSEDPTFKGELVNIRDIFKDSLRDLVPMLLAPENLILKEVNGQKIKARDLLQYFKSYMEIFKSDKLPEPRSILMATAEADNLIAEADAIKFYTKLMTEVCGEGTPHLNSKGLAAKHKEMKERALSEFSSKRKMGGEKFSKEYLERLEKELDDAVNTFKKLNALKGKLAKMKIIPVANISAAIDVGGAAATHLASATPAAVDFVDCDAAAVDFLGDAVAADRAGAAAAVDFAGVAATAADIVGGAATDNFVRNAAAAADFVGGAALASSTDATAATAATAAAVNGIYILFLMILKRLMHGVVAET